MTGASTSIAMPQSDRSSDVLRTLGLAGLALGAALAGWRGLRTTKPRDESLAPPAWMLAFEAGYPVTTLRGRLALRAMARAHRPLSDRRPILLIPGFLADARSLFVLHACLRLAGYRARPWGLGRNMGAQPDAFDRMEHKLEAMAERYRQPVTLIGWSLGGVFARELAKRRPELVREVITLGSPFSGSVRANNLWWLYERISGHPADAPPVKVVLTEKPPVPTTAFWSRRDGVIAPASARGQDDERDAMVELTCSHMGFVSDPLAINALLDHLARSANGARLPFSD